MPGNIIRRIRIPAGKRILHDPSGEKYTETTKEIVVQAKHWRFKARVGKSTFWSRWTFEYKGATCYCHADDAILISREQKSIGRRPCRKLEFAGVPGRWNRSKVCPLFSSSRNSHVLFRGDEVIGQVLPIPFVSQYQALLGGVMLGEFASIADTKAAVEKAAHKKFDTKTCKRAKANA